MGRNIIVVGAGPAGLSLARGLARSRHRVIMVEPQSREQLADPEPDGREIALTKRSVATLRDLAAWDHIPAGDAYPLRQARVRNGASPFAMAIGSHDGDALGTIVSNHHIRKALFAAVERQPNVEIRYGRKVVAAQCDRNRARVTLDDGSELAGDLLVAADSRFSATRAMVGIGASITRFRHTMMVGRIAHARPHNGIATEWFDHGRTIAVLPLAEGVSSIVLTMADGEAERVYALPDEELRALYANLLGGEWGDISLVTRPRAYPLAMTFARRFSSERFALVGDAAVGMHPVTAHGFNFGLLGASRLAALVGPATDPGSALLLRRYAVRHRLVTRPLYEATLQLVRLFTDDRRRARPLRSAVLRMGALPPVTRAMGRLLSEARAG
ncbi:MAG: 5-demethoxyubiquinol-8 5-hydroxylase UbiM [Sphingomonadales bacterium]|nr:5-demethoxyubiquinol-8 5-hydroxylase UbiM [Sphingomonadales bacterium]MBD3774915.1 5-demethoxyubiquinol-8 5-hydroxylase UbiM [Paracoccaceae bacterium]